MEISLYRFSFSFTGVILLVGWGRAKTAGRLSQTVDVPSIPSLTPTALFRKCEHPQNRQWCQHQHGNPSEEDHVTLLKHNSPLRGCSPQSPASHL